MNNEKAPFELMKEFAERTNRKFDFCEKEYPISSIRPRSFKRQYVIIMDIDEAIYFISFADTKAFDENSFFSGFFFPVSSPDTYKVIIRRKNFLDHAMLFKKRQNLFEHGFDNKVIIEQNDENETLRIFNNLDVQHHVSKSLKLDGRLRIGINNIDLTMFPVEKRSSYFGMFIKDEWITDDAIIEDLFKQTRLLMRFIK